MADTDGKTLRIALKLNYKEQNDNKAIVLTDVSNWDSTGDIWGNGVDPTAPGGVLYEIYVNNQGEDFSPFGSNNNNPGARFVANQDVMFSTDAMIKEVTPMVNEITTLSLDVKITQPDGSVSDTYTIDLYNEFGGPFSSEDQLVFTIDAGYLGGTSGDELPDGLYELTYTMTYKGYNQNDGTTITADPLDVTILVYGQVKVEVYDILRQIPKRYACDDAMQNEYIKEADLYAAYLSSIETSAYIAKTEELLAMLNVLNNMIKNGSNIDW